MHNDLFTIGKFTLHGYSVCIALGYIVGVSLCLLKAKKEKKNGDVITDFALIALVAGFLGAKLLYIIVEFKTFLERPLDVIGFSGFVVYGGIITGAIALMVYSKIKKINCFEYVDFMIPFIALVQGFGRIGCFMAGCCYGAPTDSCIGVVFPQGSLAPAGVKLWPTQLFSSAGNFVIFAILILFTELAKKNQKLARTGNVSMLYLLLYGVGRFAVEFFRNDDRGNVGALSTSQFISVFIVAAAIIGGVYINFLRDKTKKKEENN